MGIQMAHLMEMGMALLLEDRTVMLMVMDLARLKEI